jgi:hypothetical protein
MNERLCLIEHAWRIPLWLRRNVLKMRQSKDCFTKLNSQKGGLLFLQGTGSLIVL